MPERVLCVDDEPAVLDALRRNLRKQFELETAVGGSAALEMIRSKGPFAVVLSDMYMPGMTGVELLAKVKEIAPETVRMMLTGQGDLQVAIRAVHEGSVFRFLTKPCPPDQVAEALRAGIRQYQLVTAERVLLEDTLNGAIGVLMDVLAAVSPEAFGRAQMIQTEIAELARYMGLPDVHEYELAALMSSVGLVAVPPQVMTKIREEKRLAPHEAEMLAGVPEFGAALISKIPRLERVAQMVRYQAKNFDGSGVPADSVRMQNIPLGARMLRVLADLVEMLGAGESRGSAIDELRSRQGAYDPTVIGTVEASYLASRGLGRVSTAQSISLRELRVGMILLSDLVTEDGQLLICSGTRLSEGMLQRVRNFSRVTALREPIRVTGPD